jgi:pimeloyl-ACP methyl ester carboxylesterase
MMVVTVALLALVSAGVLYQAIGARRSARQCVCPGALIDVGGRRLHVVTAGSGVPAVVFEAGIAASSLSWAHVLPEIAKITRACAYDRAGFAWSDSDPRRHTLAHIVADLDAVLANAAVHHPCVMVGHSFGCLVACTYASRRPSAVAGLVLVDPPAATEWREPTPHRRRLLRRGIRLSHVGAILARLGVVRASLALLTGGAPRVPGTLVKTLGPTVAGKLQHLVAQVRKLPPEIHPFVQAHWSDPKCFRALAGHLSVLQEAAAFVAGLYALPAVPLVVISSGQLSAEQIDEHRELARLSSSGRHLVAEHSGHWIQFDQPQLVVAAIRGIVNDVRAGHHAMTPQDHLDSQSA